MLSFVLAIGFALSLQTSSSEPIIQLIIAILMILLVFLMIFVWLKELNDLSQELIISLQKNLAYVERQRQNGKDTQREEQEIFVQEAQLDRYRKWAWVAKGIGPAIFFLWVIPAVLKSAFEGLQEFRDSNQKYQQGYKEVRKGLDEFRLTASSPHADTADHPGSRLSPEFWGKQLFVDNDGEITVVDEAEADHDDDGTIIVVELTDADDDYSDLVFRSGNDH